MTTRDRVEFDWHLLALSSLHGPLLFWKQMSSTHRRLSGLQGLGAGTTGSTLDPYFRAWTALCGQHCGCRVGDMWGICVGKDMKGKSVGVQGCWLSPAPSCTPGLCTLCTRCAGLRWCCPPPTSHVAPTGTQRLVRVLPLHYLGWRGQVFCICK